MLLVPRFFAWISLRYECVAVRAVLIATLQSESQTMPGRHSTLNQKFRTATAVQFDRDASKIRTRQLRRVTDLANVATPLHCPRAAHGSPYLQC